MKICVLGCGLRTPLLLHGLLHSGLDLSEVALFDCDLSQSELMAKLGVAIANSVGREGSVVQISAIPEIEPAIRGADFVISSIRVGGMETRASDERLALECGFAGQETTGPAGFAMALRTIPVALSQARIVERLAPSAWIINLTNPAGIVTQAISSHTDAKVIGICDTPAELFYQITRALDEPTEDVECGYFGLNHLGWVNSVHVRGQEAIDLLFANDRLLRRLYPTELFAPDLIRALGAIPTEYLFFYYNQALARDNQRRAGVTRGEELQKMNGLIKAEIETYIRSDDVIGAMAAYRRYLNRRNSSYMRLEADAHSAFEGADPDWDPFEGATGYHRIAVSAITALSSAAPKRLVLNVRNRGSVEGLRHDDIVEVPCLIDRTGPRPFVTGPPSESLRGLILSVKQYERLTIQAAVERRRDLAALALTINPIVGSWDAARQFLDGLGREEPDHFSSFRSA